MLEIDSQAYVTALIRKVEKGFYIMTHTLERGIHAKLTSAFQIEMPYLASLLYELDFIPNARTNQT
jgi:hypothetical protein